MESKLMTIVFAASSGAFYFNGESKWLAGLFIVLSFLSAIEYFEIDKEKSAK